MSKYNKKVFVVAKKLAGEHLEGVLKTAEQLEQLGKSAERALADALAHYGFEGPVK